MVNYTVAGLSIERFALIEKLALSIKASDTFARMMVLGRIKAIDRELKARKDA